MDRLDGAGHIDNCPVIAYTSNVVILSVRHKGLKRLLEKNDPSGLSHAQVDRIRKILTALIVVDDLNELKSSAPPGWRIHQLTGTRKGTWSISVSGNWRITFEESDGEIVHLDLEDYH